MTTRAHGLAQYVVYDSPFAMVSDSPDAYRKPDGGWADGADFVAEVPAAGSGGAVAVIAPAR
jgi:alpha-glucosidase